MMIRVWGRLTLLRILKQKPALLPSLPREEYLILEIGTFLGMLGLQANLRAVSYLSPVVTGAPAEKIGA